MDTLGVLWDALNDRFVMAREIGHGGMATVYLATQRRPRRDVAIKVLDNAVSSALARKRFLREVTVASKLSHPNIVPIFSAGEAAGFLYFVMPYIDGENVRQRLERRGPFRPREAVRIASDVAGALDYAHRAGVVHRDIKPENILLSNGHVVVADFGIARAITVSGGETLTQTGLIVGTPLYMSPEQAAAIKAVDGRADVYSLGCVVCEMITGEPPTLGLTRCDGLPDGQLTSPLKPVLERALAEDRSERFQTAHDLAAALDHVLGPRRRVGAGIRTVLRAGSSWLRWVRGSTPPDGGRNRQ